MSKLLERAAIICEDLLPIIEKLDDQDAVSYGRLLCQRLHEYQAYVTVIGETSTGKSTLINGLFYRNLLPAKAKPTSGTVVQVKLTEEEKPEFYVVNKDASLDEIDQVIFEKIAELPEENTLRLLAYVNPTDSSFYGLNIFDTPGYNSLIVEHEEALKEFIPNSDLLVFACGYRTGFNQIDQDLFEVVRESIPNKDIPIILAINRVPPGTNISNGRIKEIIHNAEDSLHQKVNTVMVNEVDKKRDPGVRPNTMDLWHQVNTIIQDPSVQEVVDRSLLQLLQGFIDDSISSVDLMISYHSIKREDTVALQKQHSILKQAHLKSVNAVFSCSRRLKSLLPPSIDQAANNIERSIVYDIESSNKWLGKDDTYAWIQGHALPIGMKKEGRIIESLISIELDRLDEELEEIANTAIKEIKRSIQLKADTETEIFEKALKNLLQRSLAKYIGRSLSRLGGRGGLAAGAGNFAKMAVKRVGKLFGKKFPRPVYAKIGRIFNKKFIAKANVILMVAIEVIDFTVESHRWKGKLTKAVEKTLREWKTEIMNDMVNEVLPSIEKENLQGVDDIYLEDMQHIETILQMSNKEIDESISSLILVRENLVQSRESFIKLLSEGENNDR